MSLDACFRTAVENENAVLWGWGGGGSGDTRFGLGSGYCVYIRPSRDGCEPCSALIRSRAWQKQNSGKFSIFAIFTAVSEAPSLLALLVMHAAHPLTLGALSSVQFSRLTDWVVGGHEERFSRDPLPVCCTGGHCEQFWHGLGCPLFDVVHSAFPLPTTATPTLARLLC